MLAADASRIVEVLRSEEFSTPYTLLNISAYLANGIILYMYLASYHRNRQDSEVLLTYCTRLEVNNDVAICTLTLVDSDIELMKSRLPQ